MLMCTYLAQPCDPSHVRSVQMVDMDWKNIVVNNSRLPLGNRNFSETSILQKPKGAQIEIVLQVYLRDRLK